MILFFKETGVSIYHGSSKSVTFKVLGFKFTTNKIIFKRMTRLNNSLMSRRFS